MEKTKKEEVLLQIFNNCLIKTLELDTFARKSYSREKYVKVFIMYYINNKSMPEIGKELNLSATRIGDILRVFKRWLKYSIILHLSDYNQFVAPEKDEFKPTRISKIKQLIIENKELKRRISLIKNI